MPDCDLISDTHLDFYEDANEKLEAIEPTSQTLVIAGDFTEARNLKPEWATILSEKYKRIYYVLGNHEWYGLSFKRGLARELHVALPANWVVLNNAQVNDFKGSTLWFPNQPDNRMHERGWSDFKWIGHSNPAVYEQHEIDKKFLFNDVYAPVWVVHHLPFWQSVHPKFTHADSNRFFVGDLAREMWTCENPPKVILHGHTHESFDYMWGSIHVVANPFGYPNEHPGRTRIVPKLVEW